MSNFPHTFDYQQFKQCSNMEAVSIFYQHNMDMFNFFSDQKELIANAKRVEKGWTPLEIISHLLYWDYYFFEKRIKPIVERLPKLEVLGIETINLKSILIASKGLNHLLKDFERSRKQMINYLGQLSDQQWEGFSYHPTWKRTDLYRVLEEIVRHDYHHGAVIFNQISKK